MTRHRNPGLRLVILAGTTVAGLATVPTHGADATLARDRPTVALAGADRWRLRPSQAGIVLPVPSHARFRPAMPIPEERRQVRHVYPALTEAR
ncbi:hypothetical protein [uncultured Methylobacterium sp.]|uniref:hypothetical protein n=1 Tax=uncultured Methylobacterium sp. TaxID=157278 RepID=UPI0035CC293F